MAFSMDIRSIFEACAARVVAGCEPLPGRVATAMTWDSRAVEPGMVFFGFPGERVDGCDFSVQAVSAGAACLLLTRTPTADELAAAQQAGCAIGVVSDGPAAVTALAQAWRAMIDPVCVGVTGSVGKTTTKDLLSSVLTFRGGVCATRGNQNNELGVPATILSASADDATLVVEVGMRGRHQIDVLCQSLVHPTIGVVTNVGTSHLELLGTRENIARAKAELFESLPDDGLAVIPGDDDFAWLLGQIAQQGRASKLATLAYGLGEGCDVRATNVAVDALGCASFDLALPDGSGARVELPIVGVHNVSNALAAAAVAWHLGASAEQIAQLLGTARVSGARMQTLTAPMGYKVVNDAYNANPDSMAAALAALRSMDVAGRRIAVLGDMGELGPTAPELHRGVGVCAHEAGVDLLVCVGELSANIAEGARSAGMPQERILTCADAEAALALVAPLVGAEDTVLVKASHSMELGKVAKGLVGD